MKDFELVQWLKNEGLFPIVEKYCPCFSRIFADCLKAGKEETLIIFDKGYTGRRCSALLAGCYLLAAKRMGMPYKVVSQEPRLTGQAADSTVINDLFHLTPSGIITLSLSGKLGSMKHIGKSFRGYVKSMKHRFVSTTGLQDLETRYYKQLFQAIDIDYAKLRQRGRALKQEIDYANEARITTAKGTNLYADIRGRTAISNDADYSVRGGNIPAGEVYFATRGKKAEGKIVIDGTMRCSGSTIAIKEPVVMRVEKGEVISIEGGEEARLLEKTFDAVSDRSKHTWGIRRLGEIGIGINDGASIIPLTIVSEKMLGTAHVGIGSNAWFGGTIYALSHFDQVFRNAKIYLDNKKVDIS